MLIYEGSRVTKSGVIPVQKIARVSNTESHLYRERLLNKSHRRREVSEISCFDNGEPQDYDTRESMDYPHLGAFLDVFA